MESELLVGAIYYLAGLEDGQFHWFRWSTLFQEMTFEDLAACQDYADEHGGALADYLSATIRDYWLQAFNPDFDHYRIETVINCEEIP